MVLFAIAIPIESTKPGEIISNGIKAVRDKLGDKFSKKSSKGAGTKGTGTESKPSHPDDMWERFSTVR